MKKIMLLIALCFGLSADSSATHIVGGDVHFAQTGPNTFVVTTRWFRYCQGSTAGAPTSITTRIFDNVTNASVTSITMQRDSFVNIVFGDECYTPPGLCVEVHYYSATVTLANNPNGYYSSYGTCCRNGSIVNVSTNSNLWTAQIPDPALAGGNTSPLFVQYPQDGYFCIGFDKAIDFSCFDFDGDSLVYTLVNPFDNLGPGGARPFSLLGWQAGYNLANILGPSGVCTINAQTGIVTARPAQLGLYVIAVKCEEFRGGVKIGEVVRDIQFSALNCSLNSTVTDSISVSSCDNYYFKNTLLSSTGVYRDTFITNCGDSVVVLNLTILPNVIINRSPTNKLAAVGNNVSFTIYVASGGTLAFQWQEDNGSGVFNNLSNSFPYTGVNTAVLTISVAQLFMHQNKYRCIVSNSLCADTSGYGILDVSITDLSEESQNSDEIILYPNPTNSSLNIENNISYKRGKIINSLGQIVLEFDKAKQVDVSSIAAGTYSILFYSENQEVLVSKKLVIQ